jgi:hypothetical protein
MESTINTDLKKKKQKFLKEQIKLNPDMDQDEFIQFLSDAKPGVNATDVDNWEFEELVEKVEEFKTLKEQAKSINKDHLILRPKATGYVYFKCRASLQTDFRCGYKTNKEYDELDDTFR